MDSEVSMEDSMKFVVVYDKNGCIGAGACVAMSKHFTLNENRIAELEGAETKDGIQRKEIGFDLLEEMKDAANVCPVGVIKVINKETGEEVK